MRAWSRTSCWREVADGEVVRAIVRIPGGFGGGAQMNQARGFMLLRPWGEREQSAEQIAQRIRGKLNQIPGVRSFVGTPGGWSTSSGSPVQVVLGGDGLRRPRAVARPADGADGGELRAVERPVEFRGAQAAAPHSGRSRSRGGPGRVAADRRAHARDRARLAHRHDLHRAGPRVQRDPAGSRRGPRDAGRPRQHLRTLGSHDRS